jgi:hypothetical protein
VSGCGACRFWKERGEEHGERLGECHRHAPLPFTDHVGIVLTGLASIAWSTSASAGIDVKSRELDDLVINPDEDWSRVSWATTSEDDWCGEFQAPPPTSTGEA